LENWEPSQHLLLDAGKPREKLASPKHVEAW
jgi:hypothetical protein